MKGTAGQLRVPPKYIENLPIPFPAIKEQNRIVLELERIVSFIEYTAEIINSSLLRSRHLRSSTLKNAFEGKLVPQHPEDEPAEILLQRIKKERSKIENKISSKRIGDKSNDKQMRLI